ncbi:MAG TPA: TonB C-terminal domain-containing protein, partial [Dokdonella sp.]|nr:TonB C-terminal domain-containing protein [Dokdonella sp.]
EIRKEREAVEKKLKLERERLAQIEDRNQKQAQAQAQPEAEHEAEQAQTGAGGQDNDLTARYAAAIQAAVTNNWNRPDNAQAGLRCVLAIAQIPGGDVISVSIGSPCNADPVTRTSIEQAVMKAAPLPYQGYEKVFQRNIKFNFRYDG